MKSRSLRLRKPPRLLRRVAERQNAPHLCGYLFAAENVTDNCAGVSPGVPYLSNRRLRNAADGHNRHECRCTDYPQHLQTARSMAGIFGCGREDRAEADVV